MSVSLQPVHRLSAMEGREHTVRYEGIGILLPTYFWRRTAVISATAVTPAVAAAHFLELDEVSWLISGAAVVDSPPMSIPEPEPIMAVVLSSPMPCPLPPLIMVVLVPASVVVAAAVVIIGAGVGDGVGDGAGPPPLPPDWPVTRTELEPKSTAAPRRMEVAKLRAIANMPLRDVRSAKATLEVRAGRWQLATVCSRQLS
mmetsp:Transcript_74385/g.177242  ORF Transcript_74385/g.177242 Transcript_74385/m.177242 type:complete len:200 (+) Transcript_74385:218-817(+)